MPWMCGQLQVLRLDFKIGELVRHLAVNVTMPGDHRSQKLLMDMIRIVEATKDEQKESEEEIQINIVLRETISAPD